MKVIGVIPLYDEDKDSIWMVPGYMKLIERADALPVILPLTTDSVELWHCFQLCDGFLFTGGHDVHPSVYGEEPRETCGPACVDRDIMEKYILQHAIANDKPVLGICRGIQLINALLGGKLYQDLPTEAPSAVEHHMSAPYNKPIHSVTVLEDTLLADIIGSGEYLVNSYHHQAVKELAPGCKPMAIAEDGIIEALQVEGNRFIVGVQWHPEFIFKKDENCIKLVEAFIEAC